MKYTKRCLFEYIYTVNKIMNKCTLLRWDDPRAITCLMLGEKGTNSARLVLSTKEAELNSHNNESYGSTPKETQTRRQDEESNCVKESS